MSYLHDISVNIIRNTKPLQQKGFGLLLILGNTIKNAGKYRELTMDEVKALYAVDTPEYKMASVVFSQSPAPEKVAIYSRRADQPIETALNDLSLKENSWYALVIPEKDITSNHTAGNWANANKKFFFGCSDDPLVLEGRNVDRESYIVHDKPEQYPECAWAGQSLPKDPGSITWKWKQVNGPTPADYTTTELSFIRDKNGAAITTYGGIVFVNEGKTTSGEFIDVIRGQDWVQARIEEGLYRLFLGTEKVAMDDTGIAQIESVIRSVMKQAGTRDIIAKASSDKEREYSDDQEYLYQVRVPRREDIPENDRAARKLTHGVEFEYALAGAIHEVKVKGRITV